RRNLDGDFRRQRVSVVVAKIHGESQCRRQLIRETAGEVHADLPHGQGAAGGDTEARDAEVAEHERIEDARPLDRHRRVREQDADAGDLTPHAGGLLDDEVGGRIELARSAETTLAEARGHRGRRTNDDRRGRARRGWTRSARARAGQADDGDQERQERCGSHGRTPYRPTRSRSIDPASSPPQSATPETSVSWRMGSIWWVTMGGHAHA